MDLPPAHFVKDEMQNKRLIVNSLIMGSDDIGAQVRNHARSSRLSRIVHPFVILGDGQ